MNGGAAKEEVEATFGDGSTLLAQWHCTRSSCTLVRTTISTPDWQAIGKPTESHPHFSFLFLSFFDDPVKLQIVAELVSGKIPSAISVLLFWPFRLVMIWIRELARE